MPSRPSVRTLIACSLALACSLGVGVASANPNKTIGPGQGNLGGLVKGFKEIVFQKGAVVTVTPMDATNPGSIEIDAERVVIEAGATLDATGSGYQGVNAMAGVGPSPANGGQIGAADLTPGGGGANFADGGPGTSGTGATCTIFGGAAGTAFGSLPAGTPGSSGGAAVVSGATASTGGGNGGGIIVIKAAEVVIDGKILADGESKSPIINVSNIGLSGGGGGTVQILAWKISGTGVISAVGGSGAKGAAGNGGGGGGGSVQISAIKNLFSGTLRVDGGTSGDCTTLGGGIGVISQGSPGGTCVDIDGDLHEAQICGGDDCDDSDIGIHPGQPTVQEVCDGQDNDCNGKVDEGDLCPTGQSCENGACAAIGSDGGVHADGGAPDAGIPPDHVDFTGGACAFDPIVGASSAVSAMIAALGLSLARRRRRSKGRRNRS